MLRLLGKNHFASIIAIPPPTRFHSARRTTPCPSASDVLQPPDPGILSPLSHVGTRETTLLTGVLDPPAPTFHARSFVRELAVCFPAPATSRQLPPPGITKLLRRDGAIIPYRYGATAHSPHLLPAISTRIHGWAGFPVNRRQWHEGQKAKSRCASLERLLAEACELINMMGLQHVRHD